MISEHVYAWSSIDPVVLLLAAATLFCIHFLPSFIAFSRRAKNAFLILVLNILFGWTGIIWIVLLLWALKDEPEMRRG